jgi:hypothetical protein
MRNISIVLLVLLSVTIFGCPKDDGYVAPWPQNPVEVRDYDEVVAGGELRQKAIEYDAWHVKWHQPYYGGTVDVLFKDDARTEYAGFGFGDSCIWTGSYLASQALRYYVTGDPEAKATAIKTVNALDGYLHVTGASGYIARYWGPQTAISYPGDAACDANDGCRRVEDGEYAGDFWWGNTSRDQYTGWFLGMCLAYDLIDDEPTRSMIRADVHEVVDSLIDHNWNIWAEDNKASTVAPQVIPTYRLAFCTIAYHVTGDERFRKELSGMLLNANRAAIRISDINFMNRYSQFYGNNLGHNCWYNTLRLGKVYFSEDDYKWLVKEFNENFHTFTRLSHNAWFNNIYMSQGGWVRNLSSDDPYYAELIQDLTEFRECPNANYHLDARDPSTYELDPFSVLLNNIFEESPFMRELLGDADPQAIKAFPVPYQCHSDFLWQRNPFVIEACGEDNPKWVSPGVDYLLAYWLSSYNKFITKNM